MKTPPKVEAQRLIARYGADASRVIDDMCDGAAIGSNPECYKTFKRFQRVRTHVRALLAKRTPTTED